MNAQEHHQVYSMGTHDRRCFMLIQKCNETKAYGKLGSFAFSTMEHMFLVSSSATMSAKWYSRASLSVDR